MTKLEISRTQLLHYAKSGVKVIPYICDTRRQIRTIDNIQYKIPAKNILFVKYHFEDVIEIIHDDNVIKPAQTQKFLKNWVKKYLTPEHLTWVKHK